MDQALSRNARVLGQKSILHYSRSQFYIILVLCRIKILRGRKIRTVEKNCGKILNKTKKVRKNKKSLKTPKKLQNTEKPKNFRKGPNTPKKFEKFE